jgi:hypothetical protein
LLIATVPTTTITVTNLTDTAAAGETDLRQALAGVETILDLNRLL